MQSLNIKHFKKSQGVVPIWQLDTNLISIDSIDAVKKEYDFLVKEGHTVQSVTGEELNLKQIAKSGSKTPYAVFSVLFTAIFVIFLFAPPDKVNDYLDMLAWSIYLGGMAIFALCALF